MSDSNDGSGPVAFNAAEIGALAHLYRGELYRSTVWRTRLDATTNWAVVSTGLALSLTFSSESASALPLVLVGLLVAVFLNIEARRYRFFDFWRIRAHILESSSAPCCSGTAWTSPTAGTSCSIRITCGRGSTSPTRTRSAVGCGKTTAGSSPSRPLPMPASC
jgi:hypothetical protein